MDRKVVGQGLEQDAELIKKRIPEELTEDAIREVADSLQAFMRENDLSRGKVAELLGVSRTMVSQFIGKGYTGNVARLVNKVVRLINSTDKKQRHGQYVGYVETTVAKQIGALVTQTEAFSTDEGRIGLIIGDGGHGKSICLRAYVEANQNTVYLELDATMSSRYIFAEIARSLKIGVGGATALVARRIAQTLKCRNLIVIIDEASSLTVKQLNQLRQVIVVKGRCPLILAGNQQLQQTVMQRRTTREHESLDQFTSRLMCVLNLDESASDRNGGLYTAEDIRKLYEYGGIRLTGDAVATLRSICRTPKSGRLRTCSHIIAALHTANLVVEHSCITGGLIISAIEELQLPVKVWLPVMAGGGLTDDGQDISGVRVG